MFFFESFLNICSFFEVICVVILVTPKHVVKQRIDGFLALVFFTRILGHRKKLIFEQKNRFIDSGFLFTLIFFCVSDFSITYFSK